MITAILVWLALGVVLSTILLSMDEQPKGAFLVLLPGAILGPLMVFFVLLKLIVLLGGEKNG